MCGHVAVIGDLWNNDKKAFHLMLKMDTIRGPHSTGVAIISNHKRNQVKVVKDVGTPWDLEKLPEFWNRNDKRDVIGGDLVGLMGHNRWATVGNITPDNAHPFEAGKIVGMHNGTLPEHQRKKLVDYEFYDTDSEALLFNFDLNGVENVIPKIDGAWALQWYDKEEDTYNILRNKERPLCFAWKKNGRVLYIASEAWMIYQATDKCCVDLEDNQVYYVDVDQHYKFKLGKPADFSVKNLVKKPLKGFEPPKVDYSSHYRARNGGGTTSSAQESANVFLKQDEKGSSTNVSPSSFEYWATKKDQYFEFTVENKFANDNGMQYIRGRVINGGPEVRLYPSIKDPDLHALLGDKDALTFAGKVKKVKVVRNTLRGVDDVYVTMYPETVMIAQYNKANSALGELFDKVDVDAANNQKIITPEEDDLILIVAGTNSQLVEVDDYNRMVHKGCAWCTSVPSVEDAGHLNWLAGDEFLCADCASDNEIVQYAKQYV